MTTVEGMRAQPTSASHADTHESSVIFKIGKKVFYLDVENTEVFLIITFLLNNVVLPNRTDSTYETLVEMARFLIDKQDFDNLKLPQEQIHAVKRKTEMVKKLRVPLKKELEEMIGDYNRVYRPNSAHSYGLLRISSSDHHSKDHSSQMDQRVIGGGEGEPGTNHCAVTEKSDKEDGRSTSLCDGSEICDEDIRPVSSPENEYEEIKEESDYGNINTMIQGQESETDIYEDVAETEDGGLIGDKEKSDTGNYVNFEFGLLKREQKTKVPPPTPPKTAEKLKSRDVKPSQKFVNDPGVAIGSVLDTTKPKSRKERPQGSDLSGRHCPPLKSGDAETSSEEPVKMRERAGCMEEVPKGTIIKAREVRIYGNIDYLNIEKAGAVGFDRSKIYMNKRDSASTGSRKDFTDGSPTSSAGSD